MRVSIVMTYYNRPFQLSKTLESISNSLHDNFNVIIVDDASDEDIVLPELDYPVNVIKINKEEKIWNNPEPAYNTCISFALSYYNPDVIIIQNAECKHFGDVINYAAVNITNENYIPFACFSLDKDHTFSEEQNIDEIINSNNRSAVFDGDLGWYNHPKYRTVNYDFCAAISASNMIKLNGYDERFSSGLAFGDDFLIHRIHLLGLKIETPTYPFVAHQWHYDIKPTVENKQQLFEQNKQLFNSLKSESEYKAKHIITKDLE